MDERERDKLWHRVDDTAQRVGHIEQRVTSVEGKAEEHGRQLSDLSQATVDLRGSMDQMVGAMRSLRWIGIGLGALLVMIQILDAIADVGVVP